MESLTPLFKCMTEGVQRLAHQEAEEEKAAVEATRAIVQAENQKPPRKKQRTQEDLARRCRRLTIRIASMANRCFWVSAAELTIHILTDGDCLQSHMNLTLFTKQLQWAMQQCKKILNKEIPEHDRQQEFRNVETVSVQVAATGSRPDSDNEDVKEDIDVGKIEACTHSTNTSDDYAHRGPKLSSLPLYVYRMYVRRVPKPGRARAMLPTIFFFEPHYALSTSYAQEIVLHNIHVPTIDGFQCPTVEQDAEQNALLKAILFTPWSCTDPMTCGSVLTYRGLLSNGSHPEVEAGNHLCAAAPSSGSSAAPKPTVVSDVDGDRPDCVRAYTFQRAWHLRSSEIQVLGERAQCRCLAARKRLVLADTTLFADVKEGKAQIQHGEEVLSLIHI